MSDIAATLTTSRALARGEISQQVGRLVPPVPPRPTGPLPLWRTLLQLRRNAIGTWGDPAYELPILSGTFLGRKSLILNAPDAIRRVLIDNHANYGRTPATLRILHPLIGDGLFLAEGNAWKHQRRLVAPAFAPRSLEIVARHVAGVAAETVDGLMRRTPRRRRRAADHAVPALEVAGRALFSQAMHAHGAAIRAGIEAYGTRLARPSFLDFLLSPEAPDPLAWARRRAGRSFKGVLDRIIAERGRAATRRHPATCTNARRGPRSGERRGVPDRAAARPGRDGDVAGHETTALTLFWATLSSVASPHGAGGRGRGGGRRRPCGRGAART